MKTIGLVLFLNLFVQTGFTSGPMADLPVRRFRPSDYAGQTVLVPEAKVNRRAVWGFVGALVLITGLVAVGWLLVKPLLWRLLLTLIGLGFWIGAFVWLATAFYTAPTARLRADQRYDRLLTALGLTGLTRYGIADDRYRLTIAASRDTLLVVDYGQDTGFVIPVRQVVSAGETPVRTLPVSTGPDEFRAISKAAERSSGAGAAVSQISIRLRESRPAILVIVYRDRLFADSFGTFVRQTISSN